MPHFSAFSSSLGVELTIHDHEGWRPLGRISVEAARLLFDDLKRAIVQSEAALAVVQFPGDVHGAAET